MQLFHSYPAAAPAAFGVSPLCHGICLCCDVVSTVCFADSAGTTHIAHIRWLAQLFTRAVVILLTNCTAVKDFAVDTLFFALLISTKVFPFTAGSHMAVISMGMYAGYMGTVLADLAGNSDDCFSDFLSDLGQGLSRIDASFNGSSF